MKRSRFQAPRTLQDLEQVQRAFREVQEALDAATLTRAELQVNLRSFAAVAGSFHRVSADADGLDVRMPAASGENLSDPVILHLEGMQGEVRVCAAPNQAVNGGEYATFDTDGIVILWSNGLDAWSGIAQVPAESPAGQALDAGYILGAAHASLPSAAVGTDSSEVDFQFTPGGVATWVLNTASVAFSKLADLTGLSVLGRAANSTGVMAAITATAGRQVLRTNDAGTALEWGNPIEAQLDGVDIGQAHTLNVLGARSAFASGVMTVDTLSVVHTISPFPGGTYDALVLPTGLRNGDTVILSGAGAGNVTLRGIVTTGWPVGLTFYLIWSNGGLPDGNTLTVIDDQTSVTAANRLNTPESINFISPTGASMLVTKTSSRWQVEPVGWVPRTSTSIAYGGASGREMQLQAAVAGAGMTMSSQVLNVIGSTSITVNANDIQRAALTGDVTAPANSNTTAIAAGVIVDADVNASAAIAMTKTGALTGAIAKASGASTTQFAGVRTNGSLQTARGHLNLLDTSTVSWTPADDSPNDEWELRANVIGVPSVSSVVTLTAVSGNQGTVDISSLACGGRVRMHSLSSSITIEGFTAKSAGFWFFLERDEEAAGETVTLFHEDATATAANRIACPENVDVEGESLKGVVFYGGDSRWHYVGHTNRLGGALTYVAVNKNGTSIDSVSVVAGSTGDININTNTGDIDIGPTGSSGTVQLERTYYADFIEAAVAPTTPTSGRARLWVSANGVLMCRGDDGQSRIIGDGATETLGAGTYNDLAIGADTDKIICNGNVTITGVAGGWHGRRISFAGGNNGTLTLSHGSGSSAAGNTFTMPGSVDYVQARGGAVLIYDTGPSTDVWRCAATAR